MACCGSNREKIEVSENHKWDYINLNDFKAKSCFILFSYFWVWVLALVSVAVYAVDTFTAVKLLRFNEWSSEVKPSIPFDISKWIFAGCIMLSWALLIYEWMRALKVMKRESVTEDYLDPLAVILQSVRLDNGFRRFLVFAELTKSKKKVTWVSLFVYFQRKDAIRILLAEGPRQGINALTLYSVAKSNLIPIGAHQAAKGHSDIIQFFINLKVLASQNEQQAIILSSMLFTLVIWIFSMIFLILGIVLYVFYLWQHIRGETLTQFCRRKVETRLARIVKAKTDKIWAKQQAQQDNLGWGAAELEDGTLPKIADVKRQPTLPMLDDSPPKSSGSMLSRNDSNATLPAYTSQPQTPANDYPPLPDQLMPVSRPYAPSRSTTQSSYSSPSDYSSNTSLLSHAGPIPTSSPVGAPISRPATSNSNRSFGRPGHVPALNTSSSGDGRHNPFSAGGSLSSNTPVSERRYSPQSAGSSSTPWRTPITPVSEQLSQEIELQESSGLGLPPALRPGGARREVSSPASAGVDRPQLPFQPKRSATAPIEGGIPQRPLGGGRSATPGGAGPPRSMTPGAGFGMPRMGTPGAGGMPRSGTPGAGGMSRSGTPGAGGMSRSATPGSGGMSRSGTPGDGGMSRSATPGAGGMSRSGTPGAGSRGAGYGAGRAKYVGTAF